jgi:FkbM family methyltransferase
MQSTDLGQAMNSLGQGLVDTNRLLTRTRQRLYALELRSALAEQGKRPRLPVEFTSQYGEDLLAWDLLGGATRGFFIEAGAFDGYRYSVTYPFEAAGWDGLLVEAIPEAAEAAARRRPNSRVVHAALSRRGAPPQAEFSVVSDAYGGMLSHLPGRGVAQEIGNSPQRTIHVPATTLDALLVEQPRGGTIDLLVLDVEGAEGDVLDGLDLALHAPRLMIIETARDAELLRLLTPEPYVFVGKFFANLILVRKDQEDILQRVRWMKL